ncbi:hypothetical protein GCM10027586_06570 [Kineococcus gypseus]|uniref:nuclear transport factor 2 family protein n=1 Tax=Kineococcus gypseus TaxID=1637102 RepID=UPI003D7EB8BE
MASIEQLMTANLLDIFNERDADRRRAAITRTWAPEGRFNSPDGSVSVGHDALHAKVQEILDTGEGLEFTAAGPTLVNQDLGYVAWNFGLPGEQPVLRGVDVAHVQDGRMVSLYTLLLAD